MAQLMQTVQSLRTMDVFIAMVYLQEAHADDLWPLGYGIQSHSNIGERWAACKRFVDEHPPFKALLHSVGMDLMDDSFLHTYGAWPERYFLTDLSGRVLWASAVGDDCTHESCSSSALDHVLEFVERSARQDTGASD